MFLSFDAASSSYSLRNKSKMFLLPTTVNSKNVAVASISILFTLAKEIGFALSTVAGVEPDLVLMNQISFKMVAKVSSSIEPKVVVVFVTWM